MRPPPPSCAEPRRVCPACPEEPGAESARGGGVADERGGTGDADCGTVADVDADADADAAGVATGAGRVELRTNACPGGLATGLAVPTSRDMLAGRGIGRPFVPSAPPAIELAPGVGRPADRGRDSGGEPTDDAPTLPPPALMNPFTSCPTVDATVATPLSVEVMNSRDRPSPRGASAASHWLARSAAEPGAEPEPEAEDCERSRPIRGAGAGMLALVLRGVGVCVEVEVDADTDAIVDAEADADVNGNDGALGFDAGAGLPNARRFAGGSGAARRSATGAIMLIMVVVVWLK